jgi:hypothetical protein
MKSILGNNVGKRSGSVTATEFRLNVLHTTGPKIKQIELPERQKNR